MRKFYSLICIGIVSCTGYAAHAQSLDNMDAITRGLASGGVADTRAVDNLVENLAGSLMEAMDSSGPQVSVLSGPLTVGTIIPEANRTVADVLIGDARTGRYPPRLRINFAEFPLRSLSEANNTNNNERSSREGTAKDQVVQRIQNRLRLPQVDFEIVGRTAIVSGTVDTEHRRKLVESMLRFEPGIDVVKNEITVAPTE